MNFGTSKSLCLQVTIESKLLYVYEITNYKKNLLIVNIEWDRTVERRGAPRAARFFPPVPCESSQSPVPCESSQSQVPCEGSKSPVHCVSSASRNQLEVSLL